MLEQFALPPPCSQHTLVSKNRKKEKTNKQKHVYIYAALLYPRNTKYIYRGCTVFAFLCVNFYFVKDFSGTTVPRILKFNTKNRV